MVYVCAVPTQVPTVGVTVTVPEIAAVVELVAVNEGALPFPEAARPMAVFELVHV